MATAPLIAERYCEGCGDILTRSPHTSNREWRNKRFCRPGCRVQSGGSIAPLENEHHPQRDSLIASSDMLRDRMLEQYRKIAAERFLPDMWFAASMCGMVACRLK